MSEFEAKRKVVGLILFYIGMTVGLMILVYDDPAPSSGSFEDLYWLGYSGMALAVFGFLMAINGEGWLKL